MSEEKAVTLAVEGSGTVSGLLLLPPKPKALYVLAHGAGAGMRQRFLEATAQGLARRGIRAGSDFLSAAPMRGLDVRDHATEQPHAR